MQVSVGYIPNKKVLGLSKVARYVLMRYLNVSVIVSKTTVVLNYIMIFV